MTEQRILLGHGGEGAESVGVGVEYTRAIDAQRGHARTVAVRAHRGNAQGALARIEGDQAPVSRRSLL